MSVMRCFRYTIAGLFYFFFLPFGAFGEEPWVARFEHAAVAADNVLASKAGKEILKQGGNAADAIASVLLTLGVVSPISSGLGGGGFFLYYRAKDNSIHFLDFREQAPFRATPTMFKQNYLPHLKREGLLVLFLEKLLELQRW